MRSAGILLALLLLTPWAGWAQSSTVTEAESYACMGDDKSRKQTEAEALAHARRSAAEHAATYIRSQTAYEDLLLQKDLLEAYAQGTVQVLQVLDHGWYQDLRSGDCYRVRIQAEVLPDAQALARLGTSSGVTAGDDPAGPLQARIWTNAKEYVAGEQLKIYLRGNKPFHARVVYRDAAGSHIQLLPNPYRQENYFHGSTTYELPAAGDRFDLTVRAPFGEEQVTVYASTAPLGALELQDAGSVYVVNTRGADIGTRTRGIAITAKDSAGTPGAAEFCEAAAHLVTHK